MRLSFIGTEEALDGFVEIIRRRVSKFGHVEWMNMYSLKSTHITGGVFRGEIVVTNKNEYNKTKLTNIELIKWLGDIDAGAKSHAEGNSYILRHKVPKSQYCTKATS